MSEIDHLGTDYDANVKAMADAAEVDRHRARQILARLARLEHGTRLLITYDKWTELDDEIERLRAERVTIADRIRQVATDTDARGYERLYDLADEIAPEGADG